MAPTRAGARAIGRLGHRVFRRLRTRRSRPSRSSTARRWAAASRSPCTATTAPSPPACPRFALPECFLGLVPGWGGTPAAAEPDRRRRRGQGDHRERAQPEPHAQGPAGLRARHRRRDVRAGRLPRAVARLGAQPCSAARSTVERPEVDRGRRLGRGRRPRPGLRRQQGARRGPAPYRALDLIALAATASSTTASPPRTRRSPTSSWARSCAPASTPSTWCRSGPSGPSARRTRRSPARSPRSASSAPG